MNPLKVYKTYEKYRIPKYATNVEMYKIMKEKYFSKDIHSPIAQGKCLSHKDFISEKGNLMKKESINFDNIIPSKDNKKIEETRTKNIDEKIKKESKEKEISKSLSQHSGLRYKDPNDYTKQMLKSNTFYFDKNINQMLKPKKWRFNDKK